jgi:glycosyltransferase involved in cell wall biosynthesis
MEVAESPPEPVSVVIPVCDEELGIEQVIRELVERLTAILPLDSWEIIVVDDGCRDGTAEIVEALITDNIRLVSNPQSLGYGAAIKAGVAVSRFDWVMITDGDGTYPAKHLPELLQRLPSDDMVVGARINPQRNLPWQRRPAKLVLRLLANHLTGRKIPDLNSGMRVFRREVFDRCLNLLPDGFSLTTTITLASLAEGSSVRFIPIDYLARKGKSKIRPIRDTLGFLTLILRTVLFFDPLKILLPVSMLFFLASVVLGIGSTILLDRFMDVSTILLFVTGVQLLVLGALADGANRRLR